MTRTIMKAVGAVAAGRNRKVHMKTVGVTICIILRQPLFYIQPILIAISLDIISCLR